MRKIVRILRRFVIIVLRRRHMDEVEYKGVWWLPNSSANPGERVQQPPDNDRIPGTFSFSMQQGGRLVLERSLVEYKERGIKGINVHAMGTEPNLYPLILGISETGEYISLYENNGIDHIP